MDGSLVVVAGAVIGILVGTLLGVLLAGGVGRLLRSRRDPLESEGVSATRGGDHLVRHVYDDEGDELAVVPAGVSAVLGVLRSSALVVDHDDRVLQASAPAYALGLVRSGEVRIPALLEMVHQVRADGQIRQADLEVSRGKGRGPIHVQARVAALTSRLVLVLAEDRTREKRVEAVRRDFVANVSHELKTPVGALTLLAEAVQDAAGDQEAVQRFSQRMQAEASRLGQLVQQIIQLSRLQGDDLPQERDRVEVDRIVTRALDQLEIEAKARDIDLVFDGQYGLQVLGSTDQISLAVGNLVSNAVAYSRPGGRVVVSALHHEASLDLTVTDDGIGIPRRDLERIFERFYRVDPARHRITGGTGLGLSIVKHVAAAHGGEVKVWSEEGTGSSFTLRLPRPTTAESPEPRRHAAADGLTEGPKAETPTRADPPAGPTTHPWRTAGSNTGALAGAIAWQDADADEPSNQAGDGPSGGQAAGRVAARTSPRTGPRPHDNRVTHREPQP